MGDGCATFNALAEQKSTSRNEGSVTVAHEDLRVGVLASTPAHVLPEVFALVVSEGVTNVRGTTPGPANGPRTVDQERDEDCVG